MNFAPAVGRWSVLALDMDSGASLVSIEPATLLSSASVGKLFLLLAFGERVASGSSGPSEVLDRSRVERVAGDGLWQHLEVPALPAADVAALVGAVSDNLATNVLLDRVGLAAVQELASRVAPGGSTLHDFVRNERTADMPARFSSGCADDLCRIMVDLYRARDEGASQLVLDWLGSGADHSMVAAAARADPLIRATFADAVAVWNKTGTDHGVRADVGIFKGTEATVAYAVLCNWEGATLESTQAVIAEMRALGSRIADYCGARRSARG